MGGLSILTSAPLMPPYVCYLCASKGQHEVTVFDELINHNYKCVGGGNDKDVFVMLRICRCCFAKCAVSLSIHSASTRQSDLLKRTRRTGAAVAASFVVCAAEKANTPRYSVIIWLSLVLIFEPVIIELRLSLSHCWSAKDVKIVITLPALDPAIPNKTRRGKPG